MVQYVHDGEKIDLVKEVARLLDVPVRDGATAFGQKYVEIEIAGLRRMHDLAMSMGHPLVAEDIRQMLARGERTK